MERHLTLTPDFANIAGRLDWIERDQLVDAIIHYLRTGEIRPFLSGSRLDLAWQEIVALIEQDNAPLKNHRKHLKRKCLRG